ncbi:GNAT family N-acetyltransferase [Sphingobacterium gobiense]|uniref:Histone acetyltransferase n=1 Tax=Sphingobacterium gobiense TaxID=1382456 RepID=A0A2S9JSG9_9SPHI|nr:GNAT family N-acetyltransferase [Sphingobacterium gobiense]PRD56200.1 histone acetyltransferase [Sphingobacterium gobiense]
MINDIEILPVGVRDREEVIAYVLKTRERLFPMLNHQVIPKDLEEFSSTYVHTNIGAFLQARTKQGKLIGTIGMMAYDNRFPYFSFTGSKIVEVARLYVEPDYRKSGLGTALVQRLKTIGQQQGVELLYLHTHPFLEGAYEFWLKQGFDLVLSCEESGFETLHMTLDKTKVITTDTFSSFMENR